MEFCRFVKLDGLVKSDNSLFFVIPAKAGIQFSRYVLDAPGLLLAGQAYQARHDVSATFCELVDLEFLLCRQEQVNRFF